VNHAEFVHLHVHSEYSLLDGAAQLEKLVTKAKDLKFPAIALTDHGNLFGAIDFYLAAQKAGIKPIVGCELYVAPGKYTERGSQDGGGYEGANHLTVLVRNRTGYRNLIKLVSKAYLEGFYYKPRVDRELLAQHADGLLVLSGCLNSEVSRQISAGDLTRARETAGWYQEVFGKDHYFMEVQAHGLAEQATVTAETLRIAEVLGAPICGTNDSHYLEADHGRAHEALLCIQTGSTLNDPNRWKFATQEFYVKSAEEMARVFAELPDACRNTLAVAERCNLTLDFGTFHLPRYVVPESHTLESYLQEKTREGLLRRYGSTPGDAIEARLNHELAVIEKMGFASYFLVVWDFIHYARQHGIAVGPGRGSSAGSLVAYCLGITNVDPIRYGLLFERFLNPERITMPDMDIDFADDRRDEVIRYVADRYGRDRVAHIITFGTLGAKAAIRDVGRVMGMPYADVDRIAKLVPGFPLNITLDEAYQKSPPLAEMVKTQPQVQDLWGIARALEGCTRHASVHASAVVISDEPLDEHIPLYKDPKRPELITGYAMGPIEKLGLLKMDFLGLRTLTVLANTAALLKESRRITIDFDALPLDDAKTYAMLGEAKTFGVFQFESSGMRDALRGLRPERLEDLIAMVSLYRPGPMELIPDYIRRKQGSERVEFFDKRLEPILAPTYGVMVYQEQVMQIAQVIGGYTLGAADLLRRAMGKKLPEEMAKHRFVFIDGAERNGLSKTRATQLFDLMEKFAGYGFNKSHAAAYAMVAYQTAYFKAHHPAAFIAANLSLVMDDTDKVRHFYDEGVALGLEILTPDINASNYRFEPIDVKRIRYGLGGIKGTGQAAIEAIVAAREAGGLFTDLFDFCQRVDKRLVNRRAVEALVRAGAFDAIDARRSSLLASAGMALDYGEKTGGATSQASLFGGDSSEVASARPALIEARPWSDDERLANEKASLGFYLSGHPYAACAAEMASLISVPLSAIRPATTPLRIAGVVASLRNQTSRRGKMAFVTLDDGKDRAEVLVFNETFDAYRHLLREDALLVAEVKVMQRLAEDGQTQGVRIVAEALYDLAAARRKFARGLRLYCNGTSSAARLLELIEPFKSGSCAVTIRFQNESANGELELGESWRVNLDDHLLGNLREWLTADNVQVVY